jgi:putative peptidoglycan lipid II flippase
MRRTAAREPAAIAPARQRRRAVLAALFSVATGLSRIAGLLREIIVASIFGVQGAAINAFTVAFQVPNLVRALVADSALGAAFVPVFNELLERGETRRAWRVASTVFWLAFVGLSAITAVFMVLAPQIMGLFGYHGSLGVGLARVLFPIVVLLGLTGIVTAILNAFDEFFVPAIAPVAWNAVIVGVLVAALPVVHTTSGRLYAYAIGILIGTFVQFVLPLPWLRGRGGRILFAIDLRDPAVVRVFALMLPVTLGLGLINFNVLVDTYFAALTDRVIGPAAIDKAFRIYMLPQGMFSVAVAAVLFPALSRYAAARDGRSFRAAFASGFRQIALLLVPASAVCAVLAEPIVRLLYQRGSFDAHQTTVVAQCLAAFSLGLAANGVILLCNRSFFSMQLAWAPTWIALGNLVANAVLDWSLSAWLGVPGIPLATSLVNLLAVALLLVRLRVHAGRLHGYETTRTVVRITTASLLLALVAYPVWWGLDHVLGRSLPAQLVSLGAALAAGSAVFLRAARWMHVEELALVTGLVRSRRSKTSK